MNNIIIPSVVEATAWDVAFQARMASYEARTALDILKAHQSDSGILRDARAGRGIAWINSGRQMYANGDFVGSAGSGAGESGIPDGRDSADRMHATTILKLARGTGNSALPRETVRVSNKSRAAWVDSVAREAIDNMASGVVTSAEKIMAAVVATGQRNLLPASV